MNRLISDVRSHALDLLGNDVGLDQEAADLHHCLFNESCFIIGIYQAKKWLGEYAFDAIAKIQEYETDNFGEINTDLGDPEKVCNMLAYILGEEVLQDSQTLQDKFDDVLTKEDLKAIEEELKQYSLVNA
tara:strand:- start:108 stop:497 length:390 start_codon:yes stop_codon:yes gene_type:complete